MGGWGDGGGILFFGDVKLRECMWWLVVDDNEVGRNEVSRLRFWVLGFGFEV